MFELRDYQQRSLDALDAYLRLAAEMGAKKAFVHQTERPYRSVSQLTDLPYVCLRIPTGGGKTLMACHALGIATREFLRAERAACLWLVPSNAIKDQTLAALRDRQHPYRQAVDAQFSGLVSVMDLTEALYVQRGVLDGETVIIVSTLAALRVEDTDGRKVYESAGALQHHFSGLPARLEDVLEKRDDGSVAYSLANVLRLRRPVVIMDEAHNARTKLSFDTLARLSPSCIVEFTATPETKHKPESGYFASNVLHHVSAAELKAENMVKLPIKLHTRVAWKEVVADAVQTQRELERAAREEENETGEYLRPIVLYQAQPKRKDKETLTVAVVKQCLREDFKVPEEQIAIATGETREIDDVDLYDPSCPLRHIITVAALKEGWDCRFAYVLCSVAEIGSSRAVEQILGRILRLPNVQKKGHEELNCSYAFVASQRFLDAARSLTDALFQNGFHRLEAEQLVTPVSDTQMDLFGPYSLSNRVQEPVSEKPDLSKLGDGLRDRVRYDDETQTLQVIGPVSDADGKSIEACFSRPTGKEVAERILNHCRRTAASALSPSQRGEPFMVPQLAVRVRGRLELFEESHFLEALWDLTDADATLSEQGFPSTAASGQAGDVDVTDQGKIEVHFAERLHRQLSLIAYEPGWTVVSLVNWLDRQIPHPDLTQTQATFFIHRMVTGLMESRGLSIEHLAREKFRLRDAVAKKIVDHRQVHDGQAFQAMLFSECAAHFEVGPEICFSYSEDQYAPNWYYESDVKVAKHYFPNIGELKSEGEEFRCALFISQLDQVELWVRNLERRPESSFWLQTSTDRFYPDFVAKLKDGRILVVEYKGEDRWSNDDSKEKRAVGELWADRSKGTCLFVMPKGMDMAAIEALVS